MNIDSFKIVVDHEGVEKDLAISKIKGTSLEGKIRLNLILIIDRFIIHKPGKMDFYIYFLDSNNKVVDQVWFKL